MCQLFLVFFKLGSHSMLDNMLEIFTEALHSLTLTVELSAEGTLEYFRYPASPVWTFNEPLLLHNSANLKLIIRGTANLCIGNALRKIHRSLNIQSERLSAGCYLNTVMWCRGFRVGHHTDSRALAYAAGVSQNG